MTKAIRAQLVAWRLAPRWNPWVLQSGMVPESEWRRPTILEVRAAAYLLRERANTRDKKLPQDTYVYAGVPVIEIRSWADFLTNQRINDPGNELYDRTKARIERALMRNQGE